MLAGLNTHLITPAVPGNRRSGKKTPHLRYPSTGFAHHPPLTGCDEPASGQLGYRRKGSNDHRPSNAALGFPLKRSLKYAAASLSFEREAGSLRFKTIWWLAPHTPFREIGGPGKRARTSDLPPLDFRHRGAVKSVVEGFAGEWARAE